MQVVDGISQQVPDPCNEPLSTTVEWSILDRAAGFVEGDGFKAFVTRTVGPGLATATPPIILRVAFKGVFLEKVIL